MNIYSKHNYPFGYYVYAYLRNDGSPYYIGKGKHKRAWDKNHCVCIPKNSKRIVILESNLTNIGALALERRYIRWYGRKDLKTGILRNKTEGGEGPSSIDRIGNRNPMFGKPQSQHQKQNQSSIMLGVPKSNITKERMREAKRGLYLGLTNPNADFIKYKFFNKISGEIVICTQYDFKIKYDLDQGNVSKLVSGKYHSTKNWVIVK
jgi:hypothetical protein